MPGLNPKFKFFDQNNPRYQRAIQKLRRMTPDQRAVLDSAFIDQQFAESHMGKVLNSMNIEANRKRRKSSVETARRQLDRRQRAYEFGKKDRRMSNIIGAAGLGVNMYSGFADRAYNRRIADMIGAQNQSFMNNIDFYRGL